MILERIMSGTRKVPASAALRARALQVADELASGDVSVEGGERIEALRLFATIDCIHVDDALWLAERLAAINNAEQRELARECFWQVYPTFAVDVTIKAVRFDTTLNVPASAESRDAASMLRTLDQTPNTEIDRLLRSQQVLHLLERIGGHFTKNVLHRAASHNRDKCRRVIRNIATSIRLVRELYE